MSNMTNHQRDGWELSPIPAYEGGFLSAVYPTGFSIDMGDPAAGGKMQVISSTSIEEFKAYLSILEDAGYKKTAERNIGHRCSNV